MPTSQWTQKQKSRRIVLQPQSRHNVSNSGTIIPKGSTNTSNLFKSQDGAHWLQAQKQAPPSESKSHYSKSQSAVKRQRSAMWIAKAHLLNMNLSSAARKANQNQSVQIAQKELSNTQTFASPKGTKTQIRNNQMHGSPSVFVPTKSKKLSQHQARLTVEKFLKKRVGEQLAIFAKAGVIVPNNSHYAIPTGKVGEVFSSIAKTGNSRADSNLEIVQMLRAGAKQAAAKSGGKKKKPPSTKQILTSMGLHSQPQSNSALNAKAGKNPRRTSQSRLETSDAVPIGIPKKTFNLPVHKLKKRLKQHLANSSLQNFQDSLFNQQPRDSRRVKNALNRSKSKSPLKKASSRMSNAATKPRPLTKRSSHVIRSKKSHYGEKARASANEVFSSLDDTSRMKLDSISQMQHVSQFQGDSQNLNSERITANNTTKQLKEQAQLEAADKLQQEGQGSSDGFESNEQSVADEVLDPEAAEAVLRELSMLYAFQATQSLGDNDQEDDRLSHRSHDNIGYVASPLFKCMSLHESEEGAARKAFSEQELQGESASSEDECDEYADESEEGVLRGAALIGQEQQQVQLASPVSDIPSDERAIAHSSHKQFTLPTLKAHALAHLNNSKATGLSGVEHKGAKQTATHKAGSHPGDSDTADIEILQNTKNRDVYCEEDESANAARSVQVGLKAVQSLSQPKSPSNLSITSLEDDSQEATILSAGAKGPLPSGKMDDLLVLQDEHQQVSCNQRD